MSTKSWQPDEWKIWKTGNLRKFLSWVLNFILCSLISFARIQLQISTASDLCNCSFLVCPNPQVKSIEQKHTRMWQIVYNNQAYTACCQDLNQHSKLQSQDWRAYCRHCYSDFSLSIRRNVCPADSDQNVLINMEEKYTWVFVNEPEGSPDSSSLESKESTHWWLVKQNILFAKQISGLSAIIWGVILLYVWLGLLTYQC